MTIGKCETKVIQTDLSTFRHNQAYPGIIQVYSGILSILCNPDMVYPEPWHIQNQKHIQNPGIFKISRILEIYQTSTMKRFAKIVNGYNFSTDYHYFHSISLQVLYLL